VLCARHPGSRLLVDGTQSQVFVRTVNGIAQFSRAVVSVLAIILWGGVTHAQISEERQRPKGTERQRGRNSFRRISGVALVSAFRNPGLRKPPPRAIHVSPLQGQEPPSVLLTIGRSRRAGTHAALQSARSSPPPCPECSRTGRRDCQTHNTTNWRTCRFLRFRDR
jgi:hypothetical protein